MAMNSPLEGETRTSETARYLTLRNWRVVSTERVPANARPALVPRLLELQARAAGELQVGIHAEITSRYTVR